MNRPRREGEAYDKYKESLKKGEAELKRYLKGTVVWASACLAHHPDDSNVPEKARPLYRVRQMGTYVKAEHEGDVI